MIYDDMQKTASALLAEFGQGEIRYIQTTPGTGPKDEPGPSTETPHKVDGVARGVKFKYVDGTSIIASDMQIVIPADVPYVPAVTGFMMVDGTRYAIKRVDPVPPAGTPVVYRVFFGK